MQNDFTYEGYRNLLAELKKHYNFTSFSSVKYSNKKLTSNLILRHGIDLSFEKAADMAELKSVMGISSVYFALLQSIFAERNALRFKWH